MAKRFLLGCALAFALFAGAVHAQTPSPLTVVDFRHRADGADRLLEFELSNGAARPAVVRGRLVVINVYDASLPTVIPVPGATVPAGGRAVIQARWTAAPVIGQVRALLVLNDGLHASLVRQESFWVVPYGAIAILLLAAIVASLGAIAILRLPRWLKERVPPNTVAVVIEDDDTVVTLANRFEVGWQDIVKVNRLRPPYSLKPGARVFVPKHGLRRPEAKPIDDKI